MADKRRRLEVHWITYYCPLGPPYTERDGEQGWATVDADDHSWWIFYGANYLNHAVFQAKLTNGEENVRVIGQNESLALRYQPYQWMTGETA